MNEKILRFVLTTDKVAFDLVQQFHLQGQMVLNSTTWMGKEPQTCAVTKAKSRTYSPGDKVTFDIEVSYRPKGCITYTGETKYDGWTAMMLDRTASGVLLDGKGKPLSEGSPPVYLPFELHEDIDFNTLNFGEFVGETEVKAVEHMTADEADALLHAETEKCGKFSASVKAEFMAPHRQRPTKKIVLADAPSGEQPGSFGERVIVINNDTPQLEQILMDKISELLFGFIEGRLSINNRAAGEWTFVELSHALVDCTMNQHGGPTWFDRLEVYTPTDFLELLAKKVMAVFEVEAKVVHGRTSGFMMRRIEPSR